MREPVLYDGEPVADVGFADPDAARRIFAYRLRKARVERLAAIRSIVDTEAKARAKLIEQKLDALGDRRLSVLRVKARHNLRLFNRSLRRAWHQLFNDTNVHQYDVLERGDPRGDVCPHDRAPASPPLGRMTEAAGASSSGRGGGDA